MTRNDQKEHLGYVFVRAVAYTAGFTVYRPEVDDDSVDLGIAMRGPGQSIRSPRLEMQVKCTGEGELSDSELNFRLELKNYDDLRHEDFLVPRILVVATVPKDVAEWLDLDHPRLLVRHCAYWCSLRGKPVYSGTTKDPKITVPLPRDQKFDVAGLQGLMEVVGKGEKP